MMICTESYLTEHENDTYEELIKQRDELIAEIKRLEPIVLDEGKKSDEWMIMPQPDVQYQMYHQYMIELCRYMVERYRKEYIPVEEDGEEDSQNE